MLFGMGYIVNVADISIALVIITIPWIIYLCPCILDNIVNNGLLCIITGYNTHIYYNWSLYPIISNIRDNRSNWHNIGS